MRQTETATISSEAVMGDTSASQSSSLMITVVEQRVKFKRSLNKTSEERMTIFNESQLQSQCSLRCEVRKGRTTGSVCGKTIEM